MALTRDDILQSLKELGVQEGMVLMVHSSLSALGEVEGGADAVIEALTEAVGEEGTLCMPAMSGDRPFRLEESRSNVGIITERFRAWPGVRRGLHPTHSVCCLGPLAQKIICNHIEQPTALGPESPWARIARMENGYLLMIGVDQDRNTLLHCAEENVDAPYLKPIEATYVDGKGEVQTKVLDKFPGPHRDFIGMDSLFRDGGAMAFGKVGRAVCRLMHAGKTLELATRALRKDPAAVLCNNPSCDDCVKQRAAITRHRLATEDFTLSAVADELGIGVEDLPDGLSAVTDRGIQTVEFGPELTGQLMDASTDRLAEIAAGLDESRVTVSMVECPQKASLAADLRGAMAVAKVLGASFVKLPPVTEAIAGYSESLQSLADEVAAQNLTLVVENAAGTVCDTKDNCEAFLADHPGIRLAFNPASFAHVGEHPFLYTFYKGKLKRHVVQLYVTDGCFPGGAEYTLPAQGNGEVKELMSILRCRGFDGLFCLKMGKAGDTEQLRRYNRAFWHMMETL